LIQVKSEILRKDPMPIMTTNVLESDPVRKLSRLVAESLRATSESAKYFLEPTPGVLGKAKGKRHHIIFGRRGSGKSSLLHKVAADLTVDRSPIAYVDLEAFKGHSYPDVLLSVLIKCFSEIKTWLDTAATNPASKTSFWEKLFGSTPTKGAFNRKETLELSINKFLQMIEELNGLLFQAEEAVRKDSQRSESAAETKASASIEVKAVMPVGAKTELSALAKDADFRESHTEYTSRKIEALHRNIMRYQILFRELTKLAGGPAFLLLDDLYHIRLADQAEIIDYFHRIAKGTDLWLKIGTIRHRSRWYYFGNPSKGMKLGDDADEIDLDVTLEKYQLTGQFLLRILGQFAKDSQVSLDEILADGGKARLVLASGGVARDFLTIFSRSIEVAKERVPRGDLARGPKIGSEDVNVAAGELGQYKEEEFSRDTGTEDRDRLQSISSSIFEFCTERTKANCFLVEKDVSNETTAGINELIDLKFLHRARSRVTVRNRVGRLYDAYMLDLSRYTGERARRNFEIVKFWEKGSDDTLRRANLIFFERPLKVAIARQHLTPSD